MTGARLGYTLLLYAALPYALLRLLWRARVERAYLRFVKERFGYYQHVTNAESVIWVHAVSVGETRAARPLVHALREKYPQHQILFTHMTPTGRETGQALYGNTVMRCYLPYDYPGAVARFLEHFRPVIGVLMETELWPNLIHACREHGIPSYLVNARLSQKSFGRYRHFAWLTRASLRKLAAVAAQTKDDALRFAALGADNVVITGNMKFDIDPPRSQIELGLKWRGNYGAARPVLLAASTRDGEEEMLLEAVKSIPVPGLLTIIVPRHPQRFAAIAALLARRNIRYQRRSAGGVVTPETQVVLGDSMGEMFAYYAACDIAFVGGSLLPFGGQNLIEACVAGKPVLVGPHTYNFSEVAEQAVACGAALRVNDAESLVREAQRLLGDPQALARMAAEALEFAHAHRGATARTLELLRVGEDGKS